jgi:cytidylate kinase
MKAIILCGMPAVGKTTVAKIIASKLGLKLIGGGDILKEIALEEGYNAVGDDWWDTEEGMRFMKERAGSSEFDKEVDKRLLARAQKGSIVITSYTLPWLAKDGIKVWLSGTKQSRAERMATRDSSSPVEVAKVIEERDRKNFALYKNLYAISFGKDLSPFNLVVGTDGVPAAKVADEVLGQIKKLERAPKPSTSKKPGSRNTGGRRRSS